MTLPPRWQYTSPEQALADARNGTLARHVRAYIDAGGVAPADIVGLVKRHHDAPPKKIARAFRDAKVLSAS